MKLKNFFKSSWPYLLIVSIVLIFFWKVILKGLIPLPGDFVVGVYFPWLDYKWGFPYGVPVKNPILADVPSFIFPMQMYAIQLIKSGHLPLWNQLILSGTPLLANFQSAPFSPTNFLYFLFDRLTAWSFQIILQHILAALFTYLLLRHWKVSKFGSVLGGIVFAFSGFNLIWSQWNGHALTASFIPLILLFEDKWLREGGIKWGAGISIAIFLQILSGYPQVVLYSLIACAILFVFRIKFNNNFIVKTILLGLFIIMGIALSSFQILPGYELLKNSQRSVELEPYDWTFLPWQKIITFVAPDFFGNHATGNYWGPQDYTSNTGFIGIVALMLSVLSISIFKKKKEVVFGFVLALVALILAFPTPASILIWKSGFLGFNAAAAHRSLVIWNLAVAILAAFGFDFLSSKNSFSKVLSVMVPFFILGTFAIYGLKIHQMIGLRNLILPFGILILGSLIIFVFSKIKSAFLFLVVLELFYFGWKFTPFSPRSLVFPNTPILKFLVNQQKPFRVVADKVIPINFLMNYGIEVMEGYDAVYPKPISEFISKINGNFGSFNTIRRYAIIDDYKSELLDLANVKYLIISNDEVTDYLADKKFKIVFEDKSVAVLENLNVYPRAFILGDEKFKNSEVNYLKYQNDESLIKVDSKEGGKLVVTDSYFPGWKSYIDGKEIEINLYDGVFRSINIPGGTHEVEFIYKPDSFYLGLKISLVSLVALVFLLFYTLRIKNSNVKD